MNSTYRLIGAGLLLGSTMFISGCTFTDRPIFPEVGERNPLRDNVICTDIGVDGDPGQDQFYNVVEVDDETGGGYKYYSFPISSSDSSMGEPIVFSIHKTDTKGAYIGQAFADSGYHYFWYNMKTGMVSYMEAELMSADTLALAEKHNVALETKTRDYYQMVHGDDEDIKNFLLAYGPIFKGGGMKCKRE